MMKNRVLRFFIIGVLPPAKLHTLETGGLLPPKAMRN
jgi:hypothetical protein